MCVFFKGGRVPCIPVNKIRLSKYLVIFYIEPTVCVAFHRHKETKKVLPISSLPSKAIEKIKTICRNESHYCKCHHHCFKPKLFIRTRMYFLNCVINRKEIFLTTLMYCLNAKIIFFSLIFCILALTGSFALSSAISLLNSSQPDNRGDDIGND